MTQYTALLDANVLYSAPVRDLFMQLAVSDVFRARWTENILPWSGRCSPPAPAAWSFTSASRLRIVMLAMLMRHRYNAPYIDACNAIKLPTGPRGGAIMGETVVSQERGLA